MLRKWSLRENLMVLGKFKRGWVELWCLPFHLWYWEHLKKILVLGNNGRNRLANSEVV